MDKETRENWTRIKESLEESGATDNYYYKRACTIAAGGKDPMESKILPKEEQGESDA
jgi:hypothetical protein